MMASRPRGSEPTRSSPLISTKQRIRVLSAAGIVLLALTSCSGSSVEAVGSWGEDTDGLPQLILDGGGKLSGTDGCNRLAGGWEQDGNVITFGEIATTMMACPDVDTWLMDLDTARIDGEILRVRDATGTEIGSLSMSAK